MPPAPLPRATLLRTAFGNLTSHNFTAAHQAATTLVRANPADMQATLLLGLAEAAIGEAAQSARLLLAAAAAAPTAAHPVTDMVAVLEAARLHSQIAPVLDSCLSHSRDPRLLAAAGAWLQQTGQTAQATALLEECLRATPNFSPAAVSLAAAEADAGHFPQAITRLRTLLSHGAGGAAAWCNLAVMLDVQNQPQEADQAFRTARRLDPQQAQIAYNHGMALLKAGRLTEGWPAFNRRLGLPGHALLPAQRLLPVLNNTRLDGQTVLVTHDAGLGDTLQFARYLPLLAARGARVLLWVPQALTRLLAQIPGVAHINTAPAAWPAHDWHCPMMRLPEVFATTLDTIPSAGTPYLRADPQLAAAWRTRLQPRTTRRRIGLVWAGSARAHHPQMAAVDRRRSIEPALLAPLLTLPNIELLSLQMGREEHLPGVFDPMQEVEDFADTAAIIDTLDAVVSVDTSTAHLAAAMGKPVLLLNRYDTCWRWLADRPDSPWYADVRIFRQASWNDWSGPVAALTQHLGG